MESGIQTLGAVVDRSKKHEGAHALVYHLLGRTVIDWHVNTYQGQSRHTLASTLSSRYAQPAFISLQPRKEHEDRDILGDFAGLSAEDDEKRFRYHIRCTLQWNDLHDSFYETKRRLQEVFGWPVMHYRVRVVLTKVYQKLANVLRQPGFQHAIGKVGDLIEEESAERKVADPITGWLEERKGEPINLKIEQVLQTEFGDEEIATMKSNLEKIRVDHVIEAYRRLKNGKKYKFDYRIL